MRTCLRCNRIALDGTTLQKRPASSSRYVRIDYMDGSPRSRVICTCHRVPKELCHPSPTDRRYAFPSSQQLASKDGRRFKIRDYIRWIVLRSEAHGMYLCNSLQQCRKISTAVEWHIQHCITADRAGNCERHIHAHNGSSTNITCVRMLRNVGA